MISSSYCRCDSRLAWWERRLRILGLIDRHFAVRALLCMINNAAWSHVMSILRQTWHVL